STFRRSASTRTARPGSHCCSGSGAEARGIDGSAGPLAAPAFPVVAQPGARVSLRVVQSRSETLAVVRGVLRPPLCSVDRGAMVTVWIDGELGYCASADLSARGLQQAADRATAWALAARGRGLGLAGAPWRVPQTGARYRGPDDEPFRSVEPKLAVTACDGGRSQTRTLGGQYNGFSQQGGTAVLRASGLIGGGARIAEQALELLYAPNCPAGVRDLLLSPDQMM